MPSPRRTKPDPIECEIERVLEPGSFVSDSECCSFVSDLEKVADKLTRLAKSRPKRAVTLFETFLAGCYEKSDELDDSSGGFGMFVDRLFRGWIESRQTDGADPEETASCLVAWMKDDPHGYCDDLAREVVKVSNRATLAALVGLVRTNLDDAKLAQPERHTSPTSSPEYLLRLWGQVLRTLYVAQKNTKAYVRLTEETELTVNDCHAIAQLLLQQRKPKDALTWVERGVALDKEVPFRSVSGHSLSELKRKLLAKLGRSAEAREDAWMDYCEHPSKYSYADLMGLVPKKESARWHRKAMDSLHSAPLGTQIELFLATKEFERLASVVRKTKDLDLESLSHYVTEPVAKKFEKTRPDLAGRLWRGQGMRIVNAKKNRYYDAALSNFARAKRCFECARRTSEWEKTVKLVRAEHRRKYGFIAGFEELVAGSKPKPPSSEPSFLERAKNRWNRPLKASTSRKR